MTTSRSSNHEYRSLDRRRWLQATSGGFFTLAWRLGLAPCLAHAPTGKARHCIVLWMAGGPSQFETFDPKPGTETGGECRSIGTSVPGIRISEFLPRMAERAKDVTILRCIESPEGEHVRAEYYLHTGYRNVPAFPRPPLGAMVAHDRGRDAIPHYVTLGGGGISPAFLGSENAPFEIDEPAAMRKLLEKIAVRRRRIGLLQAFDRSFTARRADSFTATRQSRVEQIVAMAQTRFAEALDESREPEAMRRRYGDHAFARRCLVARRLIEAGVAFVEVRLDGWDTHADNHRQTGRLCQSLDQPWSALLQDLSASGLLDETIVVWMGEFGRTPAINARRGRDHYPQSTPVVLAGGKIGRGNVVGTTDRTGTELAGPRHGVADLIATILDQMGIAPDTEYTTGFGSPTRATDDGTPIADALG